MEPNLTILDMMDNITDRGHQMAPVSLTYDLPVMLIVAVLLSVVTLMTVIGNLLVGLALIRAAVAKISGSSM